jgi:excisionase family DNA binding protein
MSKLLTSEELAEALSVHRNTVMNWFQAAMIPAAIHEGKTLRFDLADVRRALAKRATQKQRTKRAESVTTTPTY